MAGTITSQLHPLVLSAILSSPAIGIAFMLVLYSVSGALGAHNDPAVR